MLYGMLVVTLPHAGRRRSGGRKRRRGAADRLLGLLVAQDLLDLVHEFLQVRRQVDTVEN